MMIIFVWDHVLAANKVLDVCLFYFKHLPVRLSGKFRVVARIRMGSLLPLEFLEKTLIW